MPFYGPDLGHSTLSFGVLANSVGELVRERLSKPVQMRGNVGPPVPFERETEPDMSIGSLAVLLENDGGRVVEVALTEGEEGDEAEAQRLEPRERPRLGLLLIGEVDGEEKRAWATGERLTLPVFASS